jgi:hypothetical protein
MLGLIQNELASNVAILLVDQSEVGSFGSPDEGLRLSKFSYCSQHCALSIE